MKYVTLTVLLIALNMLHLKWLTAQDEMPPFQVQQGLFDHSKPETLGLNFAPGIETFTVFSPGENDNHYNHGVVLIPFRGKLYAQWQTSARDEDGPDTHVVYSRSTNGEKWTDPIILAPRREKGIVTSGGWWTDGEVLVAYLCVWPELFNGKKEGYTEYIVSKDGVHWSEPEPILDSEGQPVNGIFEQDPHALPDGRIINAIHRQPGLIATPYYTNDRRGISGWTKGKMENLPFEGSISRELEPSWFYRADSAVVMVFRDQGSSHQLLASVSTNRAKTWTKPVLVNMPDSRAKQSAGNFPDGTAFLVNNPTRSKLRYPLVLSLSSDGQLFDRAFLVRSEADKQPLRFEGRYKRDGFSYPKSVVWESHLYIGYATNKEDVELTRILWKNFIEE